MPPESCLLVNAELVAQSSRRLGMEMPISARTAPGAEMSTARFFSSGNVSDLKSSRPLFRWQRGAGRAGERGQSDESFVFMAIPTCVGIEVSKRKCRAREITSSMHGKVICRGHHSAVKDNGVPEHLCRRVGPRLVPGGGALADRARNSIPGNYPDILRLARARPREHSPISTVTLAHELYLNLRDRESLKSRAPPSSWRMPAARCARC